MRPASLRRARLLAGAALAAALLAPAAADAAPSAAFELNAPSPCYAGQCRASVYYDGDALTHAVTLEVDWQHQGAPDAGFAPDARLVCGPVVRAQVPPPAPTPVPVQAPAPLPPTFIPPYVEPTYSVPCELTSPVLRTVGAGSVAARLTDTDGSVSYAAQPLDVVKAVSRTPTKRDPVRGGRTPSGDGGGFELCANTPPAVKCQPGGGRQTPGGGALVSHKGWPAITGVFWQVTDSTGRKKTGGPDNDELLGHHGSDVLNGAGGKDVLWGDWDPKNNNTHQRDVLNGGAGNDFLYPSHGPSVVRGGPGKDYVWAFYGHGTIDCGPGYDTVRVRMNGAFKLKNCEKVGHFCQYGSDGNGGCKKPGEAAVAGRGLPAWARW